MDSRQLGWPKDHLFLGCRTTLSLSRPWRAASQQKAILPKPRANIYFPPYARNKLRKNASGKPRVKWGTSHNGFDGSVRCEGGSLSRLDAFAISLD
jgi:hypothetical protein